MNEYNVFSKLQLKFLQALKDAKEQNKKIIISKRKNGNIK